MSRAFAHILGLGRAVLSQKKANIRACVPMHREDDNGYAQFKTAQIVLNKDIMAKEQQLSTSQRE